MADYFVYPAATGLDNGTSWDDAWTTIQQGINYESLAAGDIVYCKGLQLESQTINFAGTPGSLSLGLIRFVGCNLSGIVDGTRFKIDYGVNQVSGFSISTPHVHLENIEFASSATSGGFDGMINSGVVSVGNSLINCWIHGFDGSGLESTLSLRIPNFIRCRFSHNGENGCRNADDDSRFVGCTFDNNTLHGSLTSFPGVMFTKCAFYANGSSGVFADQSPIFDGCVFDGNQESGVFCNDNGSTFVGCRFTNNTLYGIDSTGIDLDTRATLLGCYFDNNGLGAINGDRYDEISLLGDTTWNVLNGSDVNQGYVNPAINDYNLALDATLRSKPLELQ